jgi:DNA-binding LacI/PurR family transcriptional regulator
MRSQSKPALIGEGIRNEIIPKLKPGERLPSVRELGKLFNCSINTVASALDILVADGSLTVRHGSGVFLNERKPTVLRLGILSELDLLDERIGPYFRCQAAAVKRSILAVGADPVLYVGNIAPGPQAPEEPTCQQFWNDAAEGRIHGAVVISVPETQRWYRRLLDCPVPLVGNATAHWIATDWSGVIATGIGRLAAQGCRRIAYMGHSMREPFEQAVALAGCTTRPEWIQDRMDPAAKGAGSQALAAMLGAERPDGLLALDDVLFSDAARAFARLGLDGLRSVVLTVRNAYPASPVAYDALELDPADVSDGLVAMLLKRIRREPIIDARPRQTCTLVHVAAGDMSVRMPPQGVLTPA